MDFQVVSDLHLEFYKDKERGLPYIKVCASNLILAGDIGNPFKANYEIYLRWASRNYKRVFLISGNHEYYNRRKMEKVDDQISVVCSRFLNVTNLMEGPWIEGGVALVGETLWTNFEGQSDDFKRYLTKAMNDYGRISYKRPITPDQVTSLHLTQLESLKDSLRVLEKNDSVRKILVVTHHAPSVEIVDPTMRDDGLRPAYANSLESLLSEYPKLVLWVSGHTHYSGTTVVGTTRLLSNCRGYPQEKTNFKEDLVFRVQLEGSSEVPEGGILV